MIKKFNDKIKIFDLIFKKIKPYYFNNILIGIEIIFTIPNYKEVVFNFARDTQEFKFIFNCINNIDDNLKIILVDNVCIGLLNPSDLEICLLKTTFDPVNKTICQLKKIPHLKVKYGIDEESLIKMIKNKLKTKETIKLK